jgi:hypothetical protein
MTRTGVPETDEENIAHFQTMEGYGSQTQRNALVGIYESRRAMGDGCIDAQIYAIRCLVDPEHPSLTHNRRPPTP